ncbi:uncharacterized protein [Watersipora subatra]|uniref:uncharacterized protein n=1 Tax=Watersipora subatra TaxID=2589382 RepID=UPI00355C29B9
MSTEVGLENANSHNEGRPGKSTSLIGNYKTVKTPRSSDGLTMRNMNTSHRERAPASKHAVKTKVPVRPTEKEDDIEFCPLEHSTEPEDYEDILSLKERPTPELLKHVLCTPVEPIRCDTEDDFFWSPKNFDALENADMFVAEEITDEIPHCSIDWFETDSMW